MLTDIVPAQYRRYAYAVLTIAGIVLGAIQAAQLGQPEPHWLAIAFVVLGFVSGAVHATAASNMPTATGARKASKGESGQVSTDLGTLGLLVGTAFVAFMAMLIVSALV